MVRVTAHTRDLIWQGKLGGYHTPLGHNFSIQSCCFYYRPSIGQNAGGLCITSRFAFFCFRKMWIMICLLSERSGSLQIACSMTVYSPRHEVFEQQQKTSTHLSTNSRPITPKVLYTWQSHVEIEGCSVMYFDRIAAFEVLYC